MNYQNILSIDDDCQVSYSRGNLTSFVNPYISLDDLYNVYLRKPFDIFEYNSDRCLTLILCSGEEISLSDYKFGKYRKSDVSFIKIINDELRHAESDIIISVYFKSCGLSSATLGIISFSKWQNVFGLLSEPVNYHQYKDVDEKIKHILNGYDNCLMIDRNSRNHKGFVEISSKMMYNMPTGPDTYHAYMPSIGQLIILYRYIDMVNYILNDIGALRINMIANTYWSCTEFDDKHAWVLRKGLPDYELKTNQQTSFSLYALKKNIKGNVPAIYHQ